MSIPIPEHENSRFWLFRDKFVIVEAVLNIIVQATAFSRVFFLHKDLKNERAIGYLNIFFFKPPYNNHTERWMSLYTHSSEYCRNMSEIFLILHCD